MSAATCQGNTPLHAAAKCGYLSMLRLLREYGCSVDAVVTQSKLTVAHCAASSGHDAIMQQLHDWGVPLDRYTVVSVPRPPPCLPQTNTHAHTYTLSTLSA